MVAVAGGGVIADAVDEAVGDGDALGGVCAEDDVLAADACGRDVVDPDHVCVVDGDGVSAPHVPGVDIGERDVPGGVRLVLARLTARAYWMMMLLAPLTIRIPFPLMIPADPEPIRVLCELTVIPRIPALSLGSVNFDSLWGAWTRTR